MAAPKQRDVTSDMWREPCQQSLDESNRYSNVRAARIAHSESSRKAPCHECTGSCSRSWRSRLSLSAADEKTLYLQRFLTWDYRVSRARGRPKPADSSRRAHTAAFPKLKLCAEYMRRCPKMSL